MKQYPGPLVQPRCRVLTDVEAWGSPLKAVDLPFAAQPGLQAAKEEKDQRTTTGNQRGLEQRHLAGTQNIPGRDTDENTDSFGNRERGSESGVHVFNDEGKVGEEDGRVCHLSRQSRCRNDCFLNGQAAGAAGKRGHNVRE